MIRVDETDPVGGKEVQTFLNIINNVLACEMLSVVLKMIAIRL